MSSARNGQAYQTTAALMLAPSEQDHATRWVRDARRGGEAITRQAVRGSCVGVIVYAHSILWWRPCVVSTHR